MSQTIDSTLENRELGYKPIPKLFLKYSLLSLLGLLSQGVMVLLEGFIIGYGIGERGFAMISLIIPLETLNISLYSLFGFGLSTIVGIKMGNGDYEEARKIVGQTIWFTFLFTITISIIAIIYAPNLANLLGTSIELFSDVTTFIRVYFCIFPICITGQTLVFVGRIDEKPGLVSGIMVLGSVIASSVLYFGLIHFNGGVSLIALYYGLASGMCFLLIFYFLYNKKTKLKIKMSDIVIDFKVIYEVIKTGMPTFLVSASLAIYAIIINHKLSLSGELELAAYGLINGYILFLIALATQAFQGGLAPIVSYNYGAKHYGRLKKLLVSSTIISVILIQLFCMLLYFLSKPLNTLFAPGEIELIAVSTNATKIVVILYAFGAISGMLSVYYQAMEKLAKATFFGICRYIVFALPLLFIFPYIMEPANAVWFTHPYSDIITGLFCIGFIFFEYKGLTKKQNLVEK